MTQASSTPEQAAADPKAAPGKQRKPKSKTNAKPQKQPRYHVILWDDDLHTFEYVVVMLKLLFGYPPEKGYQLADEVDSRGRAVVLTTTLEHAELKRDQIHAFRGDAIDRSRRPMSASIEPAR